MDKLKIVHELIEKGQDEWGYIDKEIAKQFILENLDYIDEDDNLESQLRLASMVCEDGQDQMADLELHQELRRGGINMNYITLEEVRAATSDCFREEVKIKVAREISKAINDPDSWVAGKFDEWLVYPLFRFDEGDRTIEKDFIEFVTGWNINPEQFNNEYQYFINFIEEWLFEELAEWLNNHITVKAYKNDIKIYSGYLDGYPTIYLLADPELAMFGRAKNWQEEEDLKLLVDIASQLGHKEANTTKTLFQDQDDLYNQAMRIFNLASRAGKEGFAWDIVEREIEKLGVRK